MTVADDLELRRSDVKWFDNATVDGNGAPVTMHDVVTPIETVAQYFDKDDEPIVLEPGRRLVVVGCASDDTRFLWLDIDDPGPWVNAHICLPITKIRYLTYCGSPLHLEGSVDDLSKH